MFEPITFLGWRISAKKVARIMAGLNVVLVVSALVLFISYPRDFSQDFIPWIFSSVVNSLLAVLILSRHPRHTIGWSHFIFFSNVPHLSELIHGQALVYTIKVMHTVGYIDKTNFNGHRNISVTHSIQIDLRILRSRLPRKSSENKPSSNRSSRSPLLIYSTTPSASRSPAATGQLHPRYLSRWRQIVLDGP